MSAPLPEPERWADRPERDATAESAIGRSFRRVKQATEPAELALEAIARRLRQPRRRPRAAALAWRVVLATILLASMGGVVAAARYLWLRRAASQGSAVAPPSGSIERRRPAKRRAVVASAEGVPAEVVPPEAPPSVPVENAPSGNATRSRARRAEPPPPAVAPPDEADVLATAFHALRAGGDPAEALRALDDYDRRFPTGALRDEARIARSEALMAEDRRQDAFELLSTIRDDDGVLTRNVRITRGELYAERGRCAEAVHDFDRVLVASDDDGVGGRALYGRASCRLAAGRLTAARADLERYLSAHAGGPFAAAARRALESLP